MRHVILGCFILATVSTAETSPPSTLGATGVFLYSLVRTAVNPSWLQEKVIGGSCVVVTSKESALDTPCQNVTIELRNKKKEVLATSVVDQGAFRFQVEKGAEYFLTVQSAKKIAYLGPFKMGDSAIVKVTK